MNNERLLTLANFLDTVPETKFDLMHWRDDPNVGDEDNQDSKKGDADLLDHECGTTGCAVGWACAMPVFQAQGLSWGNMNSPTFTLENRYLRTNWEAVELFFDIGQYNSRQLFSPSHYEKGAQGPKEVAAKIRELVETGTLS